MQGNHPTRTVNVLRHRPYPEGEGPPEAEFDRGQPGHMLMEGGQEPQPGSIYEKLATFNLSGNATVEHSRLLIESIEPIPALDNQLLYDLQLPNKYVSSASPNSLFGVFLIAGTAAGQAMGITDFQRFEPPVRLD